MKKMKINELNEKLDEYLSGLSLSERKEYDFLLNLSPEEKEKCLIEVSEQKNKLDEFFSKMTIEEREQYNNDNKEVKKKLENGIDENGYMDSNKIAEFIYLKYLNENDHINKVLIFWLAFYSQQNIILRYLLIEAALNNEIIETILKEKVLMGEEKFYKIPNNLDEFNHRPKCFIKEENRESHITLGYLLSKYGISKPKESSKRIIEEKIKSLIEEKVNLFLNKLSSSFDEIIDDTLKETPNSFLQTSDYYKSIESILVSFFMIIVENEFNLKNHHPSQGIILFLNDMYWLNEKKLISMINSYLYLPNFLLSIANDEKNLIDITLPFLGKKIKIKEISRSNPLHEMYIYAYFKYYKNNRGTRPTYKDPANRNNRYNQIHSLIDANRELNIFKDFEGGYEYDFFNGKYLQNYKDWITDSRKKYRNFETLIDNSF
jgi:hypothetical protein